MDRLRCQNGTTININQSGESMSEIRENVLVTIDHIENLVYKIRGQQVMLDTDLAEIYGYGEKP